MALVSTVDQYGRTQLMNTAETVVETAAAVAPAAISAAIQAQAEVAAQTTVIGKAETAAGAAFKFALPFVQAQNPALATSLTGIFDALAAIESAFAALTHHTNAAAAAAALAT